MIKYFVLPFLYNKIKRIALRDDLPVTNFDDWEILEREDTFTLFKNSVPRECISRSWFEQEVQTLEFIVVECIRHTNYFNNKAEGINLEWKKDAFYIPKKKYYYNLR
jgi:hypothetical protein